MIEKSQQFKDEVKSRFENPEEWKDSAPFYKGTLWSSQGGAKPKKDDFSDWNYRTSHPNLLMITLGEDTRRSEIMAARESFPDRADDIAMFEAALDQVGFEFHEEKSFSGRRYHRETVGAEYVHGEFLKAFASPRPDRVEQIAHVAERLRLAFDTRLPGVVLRIACFYDSFRAFKMLFSDNGYQLQATDREALMSKSEVSITVQSQGLDIPKTPSVYSSLLSPLADPLHARLGDREYSSDPSFKSACVVADMVAHGETSAILFLGNRKEVVVGDLSEDLGIRQIAARIRGAVSNCHQIKGARALPAPRPVHRFYVVGGRIVADSPLGIDDVSPGKISIVEYSRNTGPVSTSVSFRDDDGSRARMLEFCQDNLDYICQFRGNWIVDVAMGKKKPHLSGIEEIFDGRWYGAAGELVINALSARQAASFTEREMALSSFGFRSASPQHFNLSKDAVVEPEIELSDAIGSALSALTSFGSGEKAVAQQEEAAIDWDHTDLDFLNSKNSQGQEDEVN